TATGPLFVINGVPMDNTQRGQSGEWGGADFGDGISNLNPDDIETMTVLKGQSASALYGTRAVNGVILITTKSGKKNSGFGDDYTKFYKTGGTFTNTVSLTGGNETGAFRLSLSDMNNHAIVPNSGLNRKSFNFNGSQTVAKNLDVNVVANYIIDNEKNRSGL